MEITQQKEMPLTDEEKRKLRALIKQDDRVTWLWSTLGQWIKWGLVFGAGATAAWQWMQSMVHLSDRMPK